jgi:hypothetical protein
MGLKHAISQADDDRRQKRDEHRPSVSALKGDPRGHWLTRQERIVHGVLAGAVLAGQVGGVVQPVRSSRPE